MAPLGPRPPPPGLPEPCCEDPQWQEQPGQGWVCVHCGALQDPGWSPLEVERDFSGTGEARPPSARGDSAPSWTLLRLHADQDPAQRRERWLNERIAAILGALGLGTTSRDAPAVARIRFLVHQAQAAHPWGWGEDRGTELVAICTWIHVRESRIPLSLEVVLRALPHGASRGVVRRCFQVLRDLQLHLPLPEPAVYAHALLEALFPRQGEMGGVDTEDGGGEAPCAPITTASNPSCTTRDRVARIAARLFHLCHGTLDGKHPGPIAVAVLLLSLGITRSAPVLPAAPEWVACCTRLGGVGREVAVRRHLDLLDLVTAHLGERGIQLLPPARAARARMASTAASRQRWQVVRFLREEHLVLLTTDPGSGPPSL